MKQTVEEAANDYLNRILESTDFEINFEEDNYDAGARDATLDVTERAFVSGSEWQGKQSPWISVDKKMPPLGQKVIHMNVNTGEVNVGQVNEVGIFVLGYTCVGEVEVTHWMPIPSFEEILEANRDVLERIKEKGD